MLEVDLEEPDEKIAQLIADQCSTSGKIVSVKIPRSPMPLALIEMASRMEALDLAWRFGGSTLGRAGVIYLGQKPQQAQT